MMWRLIVAAGVAVALTACSGASRKSDENPSVNGDANDAASKYAAPKDAASKYAAPKDADADRKAALLAVFENEEGKRIREALLRTAEFKIEADTLLAHLDLQLPQIEIPRSEEREKELHIKRTADSGVHVYNGHVCANGSVVSTKTVDYAGAGWKLAIKIDDKSTAGESEAVPSRIFNFDKNKIVAIPGQYDIRVCTKAKFPHAKKVSVSLLGAKGASLANFDWSAPWPK